MLQPNPILKRRSSDPTSSGKKSVRWGERYIREFGKTERSASQPVSYRESLFDEPPATPRRLFEEDVFESPDADSKMIEYAEQLTPVLEEPNPQMNSESISPFTSMSQNFVYSEEMTTGMRRVPWRTSEQKTWQRTPKRDSAVERKVDQAKEELIKAKGELELVRLKYESAMKKLNEFSNANNAQNIYLAEVLMQERLQEEEGVNKAMYLVSGTKIQNEKMTMELPIESRWKLQRPLSFMENARRFVHCSPIADSSEHGNLIATIKFGKISLDLKQNFTSEHVHKTWIHFKNYLEKISHGNENVNLANISIKWCFFIQFSESFNKLLMVSTISRTAFTDMAAEFQGKVLEFDWTYKLSFAGIDQDWNIFASIRSLFSNNPN
jgi:hypothetical protein